MTVSTYRRWLRNLYVRRLFILFGLPVVLPIVLLVSAIKSAGFEFREAMKELVIAWQPEHLDKPS